MSKKNLSERDICTKFITPALQKAGWDLHKQILEEVFFTDGKIYVRGKLTARGERKRADYILYYQDNPIAVIEAKDNKHSVSAGIQQALGYAITLDIPCVFSSNGDGFLFHDRTATDATIETELHIDDFPSPEALWDKYKQYKGIVTPNGEKIALQKYFSDGSGRKPRYYQQIAVNRTVEAIANGQNRTFLERLKDASQRGVQIKIVYGKNNLKEDQLNNLQSLKNMQLYFSENLHAKCYFNESEMVITSMNMYEFSEQNNREMGIYIERRNDKELYESAVKETMSIMGSADEVIAKKTYYKEVNNFTRTHSKVYDKHKGYCIRCQDEINHNSEAPYCMHCFSNWSFWQNYDYIEKVCHTCGKEENTTMSKPECYNCYRYN